MLTKSDYNKEIGLQFGQQTEVQNVGRITQRHQPYHYKISFKWNNPQNKRRDFLALHTVEFFTIV